MADRNKFNLPKERDSLASQPAPDSFPLNDPPEVVEPAPVEPPAPEPPKEPKAPVDVEGVKTVKADEAIDAPRRIRVWEDQHSADAAILKVNEDATLDLSADLWNTGQPITLYGVKRRVGNGNGYEEIDPVAEKKSAAVLPHDTADDTAAGKAPQNMTTLRSEVAFNGELQIDHSKYEVKDGVVIVPPWHVDAARAAGYN
jgi:hypothetical protein